jgi:hypothetical protein
MNVVQVFLNNHFGDRWMGTYGFESIRFFYIHSKHSRQCLFDPTGYPRRVKKKDSASPSGNTLKFFAECNDERF